MLMSISFFLKFVKFNRMVSKANTSKEDEKSNMAEKKKIESMEVTVKETVNMFVLPLMIKASGPSRPAAASSILT